MPVLLQRLNRRQLHGNRVHRKRAQFLRDVSYYLTGGADLQKLLDWVQERFRMPQDAWIGYSLYRE
ncbi:MAG: hypothetical protein ABW185_26955, partial [Sedimenticola sp.]